MPFLPWNQIDTVLLDMDGTLIDLHFDNVFWLDHLPAKIAEKSGKPIDVCRDELYAHYEKVVGTIQWYCLDYWKAQLGLDLIAAKREVDHLISMRDDTIPFLDALKQTGRRVVLVTNAHPDALSLKLEHTALDKHIDTLISTHEFGVSKEFQSLWQQVHSRLEFDPARTLFVDDSIPILHAAKKFGIAHLLCVANPDSQKPLREINDFPAVKDYRDLTADILANPRHENP
ncbi:GMP/IMP nucleotidase [Alteromonas sediminis]|uniref:GMP/IMP nucleotidase n=1 Tax=Alteromonas sediminis TaxID=2259342 RepID=A0A3N5Z7K8_9ALTE|nr:GMP/IMP nucleotidase [Alteromonas sediminis]RPJ66684.1 GMP/IMP nucleotidase [Alteromonas sediminis]